MIHLPELPLYWRVNEEPEIDTIPSRHDVRLTINHELGLLTQKPSLGLDEILMDIYRRDSNVGYLQENNLLARPYFNDFYKFLSKCVRDYTMSSALEIGCGGCIVLEALRNDGVEVVGVDPSPVAARVGKQKNVDVVFDFFPSPRLKRRFDLIYHADVLEHTSDPVVFLRSHHEYLNDGGHVVVSIPDCNDSIRMGDLSMVIHQHLNYFDNDAVENVVNAAGFDLVIIEKAKYGGSLYFVARKASNTTQAKERSQNLVIEFQSKAEVASARFCSFLKGKYKPTEIGFYVPLRAFPYLAKNNLLDSGFRIFDDTSGWHNKYFDGYSAPIENFSDLERNPVKKLFIMSLIFDEVIESKVRTALGDRVEIVKLRNILVN